MRQYDVAVVSKNGDELFFSNLEYSDYDRLLEMSMKEGYVVTVAEAKGE